MLSCSLPLQLGLLAPPQHLLQIQDEWLLWLLVTMSVRRVAAVPAHSEYVKVKASAFNSLMKYLFSWHIDRGKV